MSAPIITVDRLSKAFRVGVRDTTPETLVGALSQMASAPVRNWRRLARLDTTTHNSDAEDLYWALKDVSFSVNEGEVLGVVGRNGAGKSTLLKLLSRITEPTSGRAVIRGRVSSLLEVGTGFHPDLTGRDNVYMNGTILGMTKREIDSKFDEIIDFSGVEKFLETPIKRYSSGMKVRLAFAVAAHLQPEVLIIDEVLAVGDAEFQKKCMGKMQDVAKGGRTVLFVSHNIPAIENLTTRCILLTKGKLTYEGDTREAIRRYLHEAQPSRGQIDLTTHANRAGSGKARMTGLQLSDASGNPVDQLGLGEKATLDFTIDIKEECGPFAVALGLYTDQETCLYRLNSNAMYRQLLSGEPGETLQASIEIENNCLVAGTYTLSVGLVEANRGGRLDHIERALEFTVPEADVFGTGASAVAGSIIMLPTQWVSRS